MPTAVFLLPGTVLCFGKGKGLDFVSLSGLLDTRRVFSASVSFNGRSLAFVGKVTELGV